MKNGDDKTTNGKFTVMKPLTLFTTGDKKGKKDFKFIDLFAGIGGTRIAFEKAGGTEITKSIDTFGNFYGIVVWV